MTAMVPLPWQLGLLGLVLKATTLVLTALVSFTGAQLSLGIPTELAVSVGLLSVIVRGD